MVSLNPGPQDPVYRGRCETTGNRVSRNRVGALLDPEGDGDRLWVGALVDGVEVVDLECAADLIAGQVLEDVERKQLLGAPGISFPAWSSRKMYSTPLLRRIGAENSTYIRSRFSGTRSPLG